MRILWYGPHPEMPSGYSQQTGIWARALAGLGHDVAIACWAGQLDYFSAWNGIPIFPASTRSKWSEDYVHGHYRQWKADLCIRLSCAWPLTPEHWRDMRVAHWLPVDCSPISLGDYHVMNDGAVPVAMSRFGQRQIAAGRPHEGLGGLPADYYVPHGVDMSGTFTPPQDRAALRAEMGLPEHLFVIGINARNGDGDPDRKAWHENLRAFAIYHKRHPDSVLLIHSMMMEPGGLLLASFIKHLGIASAVKFTEQYPVATGMVPAAEMARWYGGLDVLLATSCGEGFGIPVIEAQGCGTPVIVSDAHTGPELAGPGWLVKGELRWNWHHQAEWFRPSVRGIVKALESAYAHARSRRELSREFAMSYDVAAVLPQWKAILDEFT